MTMFDLADGQQVRLALRFAVEDVVTRPGLLPVVRRRIQRRRRAARLTVAGVSVLLVSAAGLGAGLGAGGSGHGSRPPGLSAGDKALLDRPTGGDLSRDGTYLTQVRTVWVSRVDTAYSGQRHLVWAGRTPAGPAAVGVEEWRYESDPAQLQVTFFGEAADGRPAVVASGSLTDRDHYLGAAFVGVSYGAVVVVDLGWPLEYTVGGGSAPAPVRFDSGVAVLPVPHGTDPADLRLMRPGRPDAAPWLGNLPAPDTPPDQRALTARPVPA
jgi:hypothetical protein